MEGVIKFILFTFLFIWGLYDYIYMEVPNYLILPAYVLGFLRPSLLNLVLALFVFFVFYVAFLKSYIGGADVKGAPLLPLILGLDGYLVILFSLLMVVLLKIFRRRKELPYLTILSIIYIIYMLVGLVK